MKTNKYEGTKNVGPKKGPAAQADLSINLANQLNRLEVSVLAPMAGPVENGVLWAIGSERQLDGVGCRRDTPGQPTHASTKCHHTGQNGDGKQRSHG